MKTNTELKSAPEYVGVVRPLLPRHVFAPDARSLWRVALHLVVVAGGYFSLKQSESIWAWILISLLIGHSLACLAFIAHDVSHNSVVRNKTVRWLLEIPVAKGRHRLFWLDAQSIA